MTPEQQKHQEFLDASIEAAREMAPPGTELTVNKNCARDAVRIQTPDGRRVTVTAQNHIWAIDIGEKCVYASPWYAFDTPVKYVKKALKGFFDAEQIKK